MDNVNKHLEEAKKHIEQARGKLDGSDGGGGGVLGFFKDKASDVHHSLLDNSAIYRAADGIVHDVKHEFRDPSSDTFRNIASSSLLRTGQAFVDTIDTSETTVRLSSLDNTAQKYVEAIYEGSIEYEDVRVVIGGYNTLDGIAPHVTGNTVYIPEDYVNKDANGNYTLKEDKLATFGHELGHVWQNQNGGGNYMHEALIDQLDASNGGDRNDAYNGQDRLNAGVPFEDLTPEQQADVANHLGQDLKNGVALNTEQEVAHQDILDGQGAP